MLKQTGSLKRKAIFFHYPNYAFHKQNRLGSAIRAGDYKLITRYDDGSLELYNLASDIEEQQNLAESFPKIVLTMKNKLDAWLTANHVYGLGSLPDALAGAVPLLFVLLGDYRYLLLVTAGTSDGRLEPDARRLALAAALCLIVPLLSQVVVWLQAGSAGAPSNPRVMFLSYEIAFVCLTLALMRWHPNARPAGWIRSVSRFVVLYYSLWAAADALILLTGSDLGFGLRVAPNLLYYGGLIGVIAAAAPARADLRTRS